MAEFLIQNIETGVMYRVLDQTISNIPYSNTAIHGYDDILYQSKNGGFFSEIFLEIFLLPILFLCIFFSLIAFLPDFLEPWFGPLNMDSRLFMYRAAGAFSVMAVIGLFWMKN